MSDEQCGLCLSCGAPFLPVDNDFNPITNVGNVSIKHLNGEFKGNPELNAMYNHPKFTSPRNAAHVFHESHHATAVWYMSMLHSNDDDLQLPAAAPYRINEVNGFCYYKAPSSLKEPRYARWDAPPAGDRIPLPELYAHVQQAARRNTNLDALLSSSVRLMYDTCRDCNAVMTMEALFHYHLGVGSRNNSNTRGVIIQGTPIEQFEARNGGHGLDNAYGRWTLGNVRAGAAFPRRDNSDILAPHVAYYLHMCLPLGFAGFGAPGSDVQARVAYVELSWVLLEIACLLTMISQGRRVTGRGGGGGKTFSHGMKQYLGALDFYVSYYIWRLFELDFVDYLSGSGIDFVQFHQKYAWDAVNCPEIFAKNELTLGQRVLRDPVAPSRALITRICANLQELYDVMNPLLRYVAGRPAGVPRKIRLYFVDPRIVRDHLVPRSSVNVRLDDFDSALQQFGINALFFRTMQLCGGYPKYLRNQLADFRTTMQWQEIDNVRRGAGGMDKRAAHATYTLCTLLVFFSSLFFKDRFTQK